MEYYFCMLAIAWSRGFVYSLYLHTLFVVLTPALFFCDSEIDKKWKQNYENLIFGPDWLDFSTFIGIPILLAYNNITGFDTCETKLSELLLFILHAAGIPRSCDV